MIKPEPWRLFMLLSAERNLLGREVAKGWTFATLFLAQDHADTRIPALNLQALNTQTGERSNRVRGKWSEPSVAPVSTPTAAAAAIEADDGKPRPAVRQWWMD